MSSSWRRLGIPKQKGSELFWRLPLPQGAGRLWVLLPAVAKPQMISVGIGSDRTTPPTQLYFIGKRLELHSQVHFFDIPDDVERLFLGIQFVRNVQLISVSYLFQMAAIFPDPKAQIPTLTGSEIKAPVDVDYEKFILTPWNETFIAHSDTEWLGPLQRDEYAFKSEKEQGDLSSLDPAAMDSVITWQPSNHQEWVGAVMLQNFNEEDFTGRIVISSDEGVEYDQVATISASGQLVALTSKRSSLIGSLDFKVASAQQTGLALNVASQHLVERASESSPAVS